MLEPSLTKNNELSQIVLVIKQNWQLTMSELAEMLGVERVVIYQWLKGIAEPSARNLQHLRTIASAGSIWIEQTKGKNWDFILDYTGPKADAIALRDKMKSPNITLEELTECIQLRFSQYQKAYEVTRKIIGEPTPSPAFEIPASTRRLNALWTAHANKLHHLRHPIQ